MKKKSFLKIKFGLIFFALIAPMATLAVTQSKEYLALDQEINNSIEWAKHIKVEIAKDKNMDLMQAKLELGNLLGWLKKVNQSYFVLAKQPAAEALEGHMLALKLHEETALLWVNKLNVELEKPKKNQKLMAKTINKILYELETASNEHRAELREMESP